MSDAPDTNIRRLTTMKKVRFFIPKAVQDELVERAKAKATERHGGYTMLEATGGWTDRNGRLIEEHVEILEVNAISGGRLFAQETASHIQRNSDEDVVMWEIHDIESDMES